MKTIKRKFKTIMLLLVLVLCTNVYAQKETNKSGMFVRVFNLDGKKINKGHVVFASDTLLGLKRNGNYIEINVKEIGTIKTKRSAGHNILIGSAIGSATGAILGAVTADVNDANFVAGEAAVGGLLLGSVAGAAIGGISIAFKNSETFNINGDLGRFKILKDVIDKR